MGASAGRWDGGLRGPPAGSGPPPPRANGFVLLGFSRVQLESCLKPVKPFPAPCLLEPLLLGVGVSSWVPGLGLSVAFGLRTSGCHWTGTFSPSGLGRCFANSAAGEIRAGPIQVWAVRHPAAAHRVFTLSPGPCARVRVISWHRCFKLYVVACIYFGNVLFYFITYLVFSLPFLLWSFSLSAHRPLLKTFFFLY